MSLWTDATPFAEIEIGSDIPGRTEQLPLKRAEMPPFRARFAQMRRIAQEAGYASALAANLFYDRTQRFKLAVHFYKQALFMQDFEDDFRPPAELSMYYPHYQAMTDEQLRTYFTWRTRLRQGSVENTSLSYAYLYIYELLNNVSVNNPSDGLERLVAFWRAYREYGSLPDKYIIKWIKDYYIYYDIPASFIDFLQTYRVDLYDPNAYYPHTTDNFELYRAISRYDIAARSPFYNKNSSLIAGCFMFVLERVRACLAEYAVDMDDLIIAHTRRKKTWYPFDGALFYPSFNQSDRRAVLSADEIYLCKHNQWTCQTAVDCNRAFVGYLLKQTEASLRKATGHKPAIAIASNAMGDAAARIIFAANIPLEQVIYKAVQHYYVDVNRTVVTVDVASLERIRREALVTQERLTVEETAGIERSINAVEPDKIEALEDINDKEAVSFGVELTEFLEADIRLSSPWEAFFETLTAIERETLVLALREGDVSAYAAEQGVMPEVLVDSINQKAYETIRDNVLAFEDEVTVYGEYAGNVAVFAPL
jgi:hypothetical protein